MKQYMAGHMINLFWFLAYLTFVISAIH